MIQPHRAARKMMDEYCRQARARVKEKDEQFIEAHRGDTDEQLLAYLRSCAEKLGHSPTAMEVYGQALLRERFGGWGEVLTKAGLPMPVNSPKKMKHCAIYKVELDRIRAAKKRANEEKYRRAAERR